MNEEIPHNRDITYFAKTNFRSMEKVFGIKRKDRRQHMYILGKSGTGKSVLMSNLIVQNIQNGEGVCVVDPHGELVEELLHLIPEHRAKDVIYFNPADVDFNVGFNVIQVDDPKYKHLVASGLMGIFTKIWANAWSARMEYILNNAILALLDTPNSTLLGIPRLLVDKDYRQMIISNLKDPVVKAFWVHEYEQWREQFRNEAIAPIQNKVGQFLSTSIIRNVVGQSTSTIDVFKIMNEGKIFLVNVSKGRIGEDNSALLGGMIITKIQLAAMERVRIPEDQRKDFYLYVDEFQNFATDAFANILSEARKYRLNLIIAHQYTAQIENKDGSKVRDAVFGNVGTMIIFRVGADDADFLEKEFEPEFTVQDLVNLPNYNVYLKLMIDGVTSRPFSAITLPPVKIDPSSGVKDKIIALSRSLYARPRLEVENQIKEWSGMIQTREVESKPKHDTTPVVPRINHKETDKISTDPLAMLGIEFPALGQKSGAISPSSSHQTSSKVEKKHSNGPSPLLKDLLHKIEEEKVVEKKVPVPEPIHLSSLKSESNPIISSPLPPKEASAETKATLKNLIEEVVPHYKEEKETPSIVVSIPPKEEIKLEPEIEISKPQENHPSFKTESTEKPVDINTNVSPVPPQTSTWEKKKVTKEVPEEVLRKVLES